MGLWLGASILAAAQLIDYIVMRCFYKCSKKNSTKPMSTPEREKNGFGREMTPVA